MAGTDAGRADAGTDRVPPPGTLEDSDLAFLQHLQAEGDTSFGEPPDTNAVRKAYETLLDRCARDTYRPTKSDLYALDRLLISMVSPHELWAEAPGLYRRYCEDRGEAVNPNDPAMASENQDSVGVLRGRLLQLLRSLHWSYTFGPIRESLRVHLIEHAMLAMAVATVVMAGVVGLLYVWDKPFFAVLTTAVYAGVVGGLASCTLRLTEIPTNQDALGSIYALKNSRYVLFFSPLTGAVFAVVTMGLFIGQVLAGSLFPEFAKVPVPNPTDGWQFTQSLLPTGSKDYALLFVWCFIAGFAERFVPDTLSELIQRGRALGKAEPRPVAPPPLAVALTGGAKNSGAREKEESSGDKDETSQVPKAATEPENVH
jgi:hypothetical protein